MKRPRLKLFQSKPASKTNLWSKQPSPNFLSGGENRLPYTPESRVETHQHIKAQKEKDENKAKKKKEPKPPRKYFKDDGSAINCNEAKVEFNLFEDVEENAFQLDVHVFKVNNPLLKGSAATEE